MLWLQVALALKYRRAPNHVTSTCNRALILLTKPQQEVSDCTSRFRVVAAGRRFGKTYLSINEIAKFARFPNRRILYVAPTYRQAKTVIWEDLKEMLGTKGWIKKVNESELQIRLINNTIISVRSGENYDALRGGKYHFIVIDETADIDSACWFKVLRATPSATKGHALFIGSPKGRNYFYDLFLQAHSSEGWRAFQFTTLQGGNVDAEEIEAARSAPPL